MVVDMEVHMVANTKVDKVATMVAVMKADMAVDNFFKKESKKNVKKRSG